MICLGASGFVQAQGDQALLSHLHLIAKEKKLLGKPLVVKCTKFEARGKAQFPQGECEINTLEFDKELGLDDDKWTVLKLLESTGRCDKGSRDSRSDCEVTVKCDQARCKFEHKKATGAVPMRDR